uniref:AlNc14C693G12407 protein n=1 Tax=Albugo laibachii Nc14 TaxID=890382 RepID=F0X1U5_9STRA|nr:AlNc14C693G12407 [Albugo laibachii Nc14]|eukprot:CCA27799.1 AlNc14C693G12407 [Albugo laibachii Nc14]
MKKHQFSAHLTCEKQIWSLAHLMKPTDSNSAIQASFGACKQNAKKESSGHRKETGDETITI